MKSSTTFNLATRDSIPLSSVGTGTITSVNNGQQIVGVGTNFLNEVNLWDYIYNPATGELRRVINILNDLELTIESPFTAPLAAATYNITPAPRYTSVTIFPVGGSADIDGVTFAENVSVGWSKTRNEINAAGQFPGPIDVNPVSAARIVLQY